MPRARESVGWSHAAALLAVARFFKELMVCPSGPGMNGVRYFTPLFFGAGGFAEVVPLVAGVAGGWRAAAVPVM